MFTTQSHDPLTIEIDALTISTPGSTMTPSVSIEEPSDNSKSTLRRDNCAERWEEALKRCEKRLKGDFQTVSKFDSPEKLIAGLEKIQQESKSISGISGLLAQVVPTERSFQELTPIFIAAMLPNSVTTGLMWGILYLAVKLCAEHGTASKKLAEMLSKIRRHMALLSRFARKITDEGEMRIAFIDIFEALIYFWSDCVNYFRVNPPMRFGMEKWSKLELSFKETTGLIEDAMEHLHQLLDFEPDRQDLRSGRLALNAKSAESAVFPVILIPDTQTERFIGRHDILADMATYFWVGEMDKKELSIYSICGIGGVGKTELALEYATLHKREYDAIFWIGAEVPESLTQGFTKIALELGLPEAKIGGDPNLNLALVHHWFRVTDKRWLLILDNMEEYKMVQDYIPSGSRGSVIVTTRLSTQALLFRRTLRIISELSNLEAESLFVYLMGWAGTDDENCDPGQIIDILPEKEREAVRYLLAKVDGLALGIQQMVAQIKFQELAEDIAKFAEKYRRRPQRIHEKNDGIEGHTLATLWHMSFKSIASNGNAWTTLGILSCLRPDGIPKVLFLPRDTSVSKGRLSFCEDEDEVDEAVDLLKKSGLIEKMRNSLSLHRLIQDAFLFQLTPDDRKDIFDAAASLLNHAFPTQIKGRAMHLEWENCQLYIEHVAALAKLFLSLRKAKLNVSASQYFTDLLSHCTWFMFERGTQRDALELIDVALQACPSNQSLRYAHLLNSKMMSHFKLNELQEARKALQESRSIREKLLDPGDEDLAATYANFGNLEAGEGKLDLGLEYQARAMLINKAQPGTEIMLGIGHQCIGRINFWKGNLLDAAKQYETCERIFLEQFGPDGFLMVGIGFAWGNLLAEMGDYATARDRFQRCLDLLLRAAPAELKVASLNFKIGSVELYMGHFQTSMNYLSEGLRFARLRGKDGRGEEARILRKQAQVLEIAPHSIKLTSTADMVDSEQLRGEAEAIRQMLQLGKCSLGSGEEDEERAFNDLVNPFDR